MKYYSYIDNLNLTIEELINLSPYKLKEIIHEVDALDLENKTTILSGLQDAVSRSYHITIEENPWLKDLFFKKFHQLKKYKIELSIEHINYLSGFKLFIEPYIKHILPELIHHLIDKNELKLLFYILGQSALFSYACEKDIKSLLTNKVNYAIIDLGKNHIENPERNINYIKSYHFYEILNLYEPYFKGELIKLYDTITEVFEQFEINSKDPLFRFVSQAQVAFQKSQIDDVATKLFIDNTAENAKEYAYNYSSETEIDTGKHSFQSSSLILIFGITTIAVILSILTFNKIQHSNQESELSQIENSSTKKARTTYDNRIRFYYSLKRITHRTQEIASIPDKAEIIPFSNPYPKTFNILNNDTIISKGLDVKIKNKTGSDLIVFKLINGKDESIYIPKDRTIFVSLNPLDSILFYSGNSFTTSKFSQFRAHTRISDIYRLRKIGRETISEISVMPTDTITSRNDNTIPMKNIETTDDIELTKLSLDNLYRAYYRKYAN
ncbi:hypothetical protein [Winogradskyella schleiferi]|uniref:hypothetical protein n=1 Tax=Winogradskyella schleiferi TaxID=2686078 RepID=UPI0015C0E84D|nr:hypothetical protein [Winogradskyella schleiferi]